MMLLVWLGETIRSTRDADLLGFGDLDVESLKQMFGELCTLVVEPDGLDFNVASLRIDPIRVEDSYGGQRATIVARLGTGRLRVQVDIGIGDGVFPEAQWIHYPSLLDLPQPRILAYQRETAIAEKLHAMVELGSKNSRMRDFFDVRALAAAETFDGVRLSRAIVSTFTGRRTSLPAEIPPALTPAFAAIPGKSAQWNGFVRRLRGTSTPPDLEIVIRDVAAFAWPVLAASRSDHQFGGVWPPGGPWSRRSSMASRS